jgi:hypothetical protein
MAMIAMGILPVSAAGLNNNGYGTGGGYSSPYDSSPYNSSRSGSPYNGNSNQDNGGFNPVAPPASSSNNQPETDYQRIMNSVNNNSAAALGRPQPDPDAQDDTGGNTAPNPNTSLVPAGTNMPATAQQNPAQQPVDQNPGGPANFTGAANFGGNNVSPAGRGAYNASPYNNAPAANPSGVNNGYPTTPNFTGNGQ